MMRTLQTLLARAVFVLVGGVLLPAEAQKTSLPWSVVRPKKDPWRDRAEGARGAPHEVAGLARASRGEAPFMQPGTRTSSSAARCRASYTSRRSGSRSRISPIRCWSSSRERSSGIAEIAGAGAPSCSNSSFGSLDPVPANRYDYLRVHGVETTPSGGRLA